MSLGSALRRWCRDEKNDDNIPSRIVHRENSLFVKGVDEVGLIRMNARVFGVGTG